MRITETVPGGQILLGRLEYLRLSGRGRLIPAVWFWPNRNPEVDASVEAVEVGRRLVLCCYRGRLP